jgi:hypothetical protein
VFILLPENKSFKQFLEHSDVIFINVIVLKNPLKTVNIYSDTGAISRVSCLSAFIQNQRESNPRLCILVFLHGTSTQSGDFS